MGTGSHIFVASATARGILAAALALVCMPAFALDAGDTLRVMTYNIQYAYCFGATPQPENVAERIIAEDPDVCGLQECKGQKGVDTPLYNSSLLNDNPKERKTKDESKNNPRCHYGDAVIRSC